MKKLPNLLPALIAGMIALAAAETMGQASDPTFEKYALKLRESALTALEPRVFIPTSAGATAVSDRYPWKLGIVTTVFWAGEAATVNNPVHNFSSSWDKNWAANFGGFDNPSPAARVMDTARGEFRPRAFLPRLNPFYVALPYNDITYHGLKSEASKIPWFKREYRGDDESVCENRWVAVRNRRTGKIAYGQWSDCGPFRTDHFNYVFGNERPKPNLNGGAGLDISPSLRDYLGLGGTDVTDWKFVEFPDVPRGPWSRYGENNHFVLLDRRNSVRYASTGGVAPKRKDAFPDTEEKPKDEGPQVKVN